MYYFEYLNRHLTYSLYLFRAASNAMVVGNLIGKLTSLIVYKSSRPVKTFCTSFSLGAHLCGFIGKEHKLTGIIALDPCGPIFQSSSEEGRLSRNDAEVIYVFHTNYKFIGIKKPLGHVDFYVNGGAQQAARCGKYTFGYGNCHHMCSLALFLFVNENPCATNIYCPVSKNESSISNVRFPQIDVDNYIVKKWMATGERNSSEYKKVNIPFLLLYIYWK